MFCYDYPRPAVTVDIVVFSGDALDVLLIQRKHPPFEGHWATKSRPLALHRRGYRSVRPADSRLHP